jgi:hypothetical protein
MVEDCDKRAQQKPNQQLQFRPNVYIEQRMEATQPEFTWKRQDTVTNDTDMQDQYVPFICPMNSAMSPYPDPSLYYA